jgi:hypothetical protein
MRNWENLYSVLKMTREGKDNEILKNIDYRKMISESITKRNIERMSKKDLQEAIISYLEVIVPELH